MLDFRNAVACQLERKSEEVVKGIQGGGDFFHKTAKNVGVNIISQSKDDHKLEKLFWLNSCDFVKGDTCTDASCFEKYHVRKYGAGNA